jgi:hypothetical protein
MRIQDRAVMVRLSIESWGTGRQDEEANKAVSEAKQSAASATTVSKKLAPKDTLKGVKAKAEEARTHVRTVAQPWADDGGRMLDAAQLFPLQDELRKKFKPAWQKEVDKVLAQLDYLRDVWGPANLGELYDEELYPSPEKMAKAFKWELEVLPLNPNSKELRAILGAEYVDEIQANLERAMNEQLVARIVAPIQNMVRRLTDADGTFKDSLVENVRDIARLIPVLNLTNDARLSVLENQITDELTRHSADTLRKSNSARRDTAAKAQDILDKMADYLGDTAPATPTVPEEALAIIPPMPPAAQLAALQIVVPAGNGWLGL